MFSYFLSHSVGGHVCGFVILHGVKCLKTNPKNHRKQIFDTWDISYPGIKATFSFITNNNVLLSIKKVTSNWIRHCLQHQKAKVVRYTKPVTIFSFFRTPDSTIWYRYNWPPLTLSRQYYLLSCIDRFTRWQEVIPYWHKFTNNCTSCYPRVSRFGFSDKYQYEQGNSMSPQPFCQKIEINLASK